jgi:hypothetical protein
MWKSALHFHTGVYPCIGAIYMHRPRGLFQLCIHTRYFQLLSAQLQTIPLHATFPHRRVSVYWCYIYAPASCSLSAMHSHKILSIIKCSLAKLYHCTQPFEPPLLSLTYSLHPRKEASLAFLTYTKNTS